MSEPSDRKSETITCAATQSIMNSNVNRTGIILLSISPIVLILNAWEFIMLSGFSIRAADVIFLLLWTLVVLSLIINYIIRLDASKFLLSIVILFFSSTVFSTFMPEYLVDWPKLIRFLQTMLWGAFPLLFFIDRADLHRIIDNIVIAGSLVGISSIYLYVQNPSLHRVAGFFNAAGGAGFTGDPAVNSIGALHSLAILLALYSIFFRELNNNWFTWVTVALGAGFNLIGLLLTSSRSAILGLIVSVFALLIPELLGILRNRSVSNHVWGMSSMILAIVIISMTFITKVTNINRLSNTFEPGTSAHKSLVTRTTLWREGASLWFGETTTFLFGYGYGSVERFIGAESTHNYFLNMGVWIGLLGLLIILYIMGMPIVRLIQRGNISTFRIGAVALSNAFVVSLFGNVLVSPVFGGLTFLTLYGAYAASYR